MESRVLRDLIFNHGYYIKLHINSQKGYRRFSLRAVRIYVRSKLSLSHLRFSTPSYLTLTEISMPSVEGFDCMFVNKKHAIEPIIILLITAWRRRNGSFFCYGSISCNQAT